MMTVNILNVSENPDKACVYVKDGHKSIRRGIYYHKDAIFIADQWAQRFGTIVVDERENKSLTYGGKHPDLIKSEMSDKDMRNFNDMA